MRFLALVAVLGASSSVLASFELALVMQTIEPPNSSTRVGISRWDPVNRVNLGYFFASGSVDTAMALNPGAAGTVDTFGRTIGGTLQIRRFNYSNGLMDTSIDTSINATTIRTAKYTSSTNLLLTGVFGATNAARIYNTSGTLIRNFALPAGTLQVESAIQDAGGFTYILSRQAGTVSDRRFTLTAYNPNSAAIAGTMTVLDNTTDDMDDLVLANGYLAVNSEFMATRRVMSIAGTTIGAPIGPGGWGIRTSTLALGHGDMIHGFYYDAAQTRMALTSAKLSTNGNDTFTYFPGEMYRDVYDSAIVVAPEPGTFIAVGVGIAALLKRRKKKA